MIVSPETAIKLITSGEIVAVPTETVYGLAADAFHLPAIKKTFETKGRPSDNPLIVHISSLDQLDLLSDFDDKMLLQKLSNAFWPGALTIVVPKLKTVPDIVTAGLDTVAVRMPDHPTAQKIIAQTGPLTAPSANRSGGPSPTKAEHTEQDFNGTIPVVDGGRCRIGLESTVLDITARPFTILRKGAIGADAIEKASGIKTVYGSHRANIKQSPGTRYTHYKPKANVQWLQNMNNFREKPGLVVLHTMLPAGYSSENLIHYHGDYTALARDLYDIFRTADHKKAEQIFIEPLPPDSGNHPILLALQDRIERAAAPER